MFQPIDKLLLFNDGDGNFNDWAGNVMVEHSNLMSDGVAPS